jgi:soluble lytic murein transglycosylase
MAWRPSSTARRAPPKCGRHDEFVAAIRRLVRDHPDSSWTEDALNALATHQILRNDDTAAAETFATILERFPEGRHHDRAAWKLGWWRYKNGDPAGAAAVFERAAIRSPRADWRPAWIYWAGRARDRLNDRPGANARFELVTVDYLHSYYGRLAARILDARGIEPGRLSTPLTARADAGDGHAAGPGEAATSAAAGGVRTGPVQAQAPGEAVRLPIQGDLVRTLLAAGLFDLATSELEHGRRLGGAAPPIDATLAWIHGRQGDLRRGINVMRRAYPQYIAAGGEQLPDDVLRVVFPLEYWDLIRRHSRAHDLDPFLVAALVAQESTFLPAVRSPANAYGLMQIVPATGRRLARAEGITRFSTSMLTRPEVNVRLGTRHFATLVGKFGGVVYALAGYNAGEHRVVRWKAERPGLDQDEFIDDIPFPETQNYVKKIMGSAEDYRRLYSRAVAMREVTPDAAAARETDAARPDRGVTSTTPKAADRATKAPRRGRAK